MREHTSTARLGPPSPGRRRLLGFLGAGTVGSLLLACQAPAAPATPSTAPAAPSAAPLASPLASSAPAVLPSPSVARPLASPSPSAASSPAAQVGGPPEVSSITISYPTLTGELAFIPIAVDQGFFSQNGLQVTAVYAASNAATAALLSGQAQFMIADVVLTTTGFATGQPLRTVANFNTTDPYAIFGAPDVATVADMKGKPLAIGAIGDASDITAYVALKPYGLTPGTDVPLLTGGNSPGRFAALASGQVGAAVLDEEDFSDSAAANGDHLLVSMRDQAPPWMAAELTSIQSFVQSNPNTVYAVLRGLLQGIAFYANPTNRAACLPIIAKDLQASPDDPAVATAYDTHHARDTADPDPIQSAVDSVLAVLQEIDPTRFSNVQADQLIDHSFVNQLRTSGYLASLGYK